MIMKKILHREEHRGHEDSSLGCILSIHLRGSWHFPINRLFFFAPFVFFVVQMPFQ